MKPRFMKNRFVAWKMQGTLGERIFIYGSENVISEIRRRLPPGYGAEYSRVCLGSECGEVCEQYTPEKREWLNPCDCSLCARYRPQSWVATKCQCLECKETKKEIEQITGTSCLLTGWDSSPSTSGEDRICSFTRLRLDEEMQNLCIFEPNEEKGFEYICTAGSAGPRHLCAYANLELVEMEGEYDLVNCSHERGVYCECKPANKEAIESHKKEERLKECLKRLK